MIAIQSTRTDIERDIRETLGIVPGFFKHIPADVLKHEWPLFKHFEASPAHSRNAWAPKFSPPSWAHT